MRKRKSIGGGKISFEFCGNVEMGKWHEENGWKSGGNSWKYVEVIVDATKESGKRKKGWGICENKKMGNWGN